MLARNSRKLKQRITILIALYAGQRKQNGMRKTTKIKNFSSKKRNKDTDRKMLYATYSLYSLLYEIEIEHFSFAIATISSAIYKTDHCNCEHSLLTHHLIHTHTHTHLLFACIVWRKRKNLYFECHVNRIE